MNLPTWPTSDDFLWMVRVIPVSCLVGRGVVVSSLTELESGHSTDRMLISHTVF